MTVALASVVGAVVATGSTITQTGNTVNILIVAYLFQSK